MVGSHHPVVGNGHSMVGGHHPVVGNDHSMVESHHPVVRNGYSIIGKTGQTKKYNHFATVPGETIIGLKANLSYRTGTLKKLMPSVRIY
jgi:hypothetical protein